MDLLSKCFKSLTLHLRERHICIKIDEKAFSRLLNHGVLRGSILGSLLFLPCINDCTNASYFETTLFADNTNLNLSCNKINFVQFNVQQEMIKISNRTTKQQINIK